MPSPTTPALPSFRRWLGRPVPCFVLMCAAFAGFAAGTVTLGLAVKANAELVAGYGWQAVMDGAAAQWLDLAVTTVGAMACYLVFKACERRLVQKIDPL